MARIEVHADRIVIRLTAAEQAMALRRRDLVLDRSAISSAVITADPWVWIRGVRAPGARIPGRFAIGTWRNRAGNDFVIARSGRQAVVLDFDLSAAAPAEGGWGEEFDRFSRVIVSSRHAAELVAALRLDGEEANAVVTAD